MQIVAGLYCRYQEHKMLDNEFIWPFRRKPKR